MTQAPTYFRVIHGWGVQMTGFLSGFPHLCRMIFAYVFSIFMDYLLRKDKMSRTNVRKLASAVTNIVHGFFVIGLAFSGCSSTTAVIFLTLATVVHGAVSSGQLAGLIDIRYDKCFIRFNWHRLIYRWIILIFSPNFSGITLGLNGLVGVWPGFISPYIVGKLTFGNVSQHFITLYLFLLYEWNYVGLFENENNSDDLSDAKELSLNGKFLIQFQCVLFVAIGSAMAIRLPYLCGGVVRDWNHLRSVCRLNITKLESTENRVQINWREGNDCVKWYTKKWFKSIGRTSILAK